MCKYHVILLSELYRYVLAHKDLVVPQVDPAHEDPVAREEQLIQRSRPKEGKEEGAPPQREGGSMRAAKGEHIGYSEGWVGGIGVHHMERGRVKRLGKREARMQVSKLPTPASGGCKPSPFLPTSLSTSSPSLPTFLPSS